MPSQKEIDAVIEMLDQSMKSGSGHVNIVVNNDEEIVAEEVTVAKGEICDFGDTACKIPNLPMDDEK